MSKRGSQTGLAEAFLHPSVGRNVRLMRSRSGSIGLRSRRPWRVFARASAGRRLIQL